VLAHGIKSSLRPSLFSHTIPIHSVSTMSASCLTISSVAVIENVRTLPAGPMSLTFDGQIWLPIGDAAVAALTYYNSRDISFGADVTFCFITARVCLFFTLL
jgi:hypothetical protein